jgi:deoxyadenosine/deoxycytidine kinase
MPIICLEGASGVGKSTTCKELATGFNAYVVKEVIELFEIPENESTEWYLERQVERWFIANEKLKTHELVLLDGDIFQPLWYNWCYGFTQDRTLALLNNFYRKHLLNHTIDFPDSYIVLCTNETELRHRKENDRTRKRINFDKHLSFIEPQLHYFNAISHVVKGYVHIHEAKSIQNNVDYIISNKQSFVKPNENSFSLELFDLLINWLKTNKPKDRL